MIFNIVAFIFLTNNIKIIAERISKIDITQASFNTQSPESLIVKSGIVLITFSKETPLFVCLID
jgi:hypothetical protein